MEGTGVHTFTLTDHTGKPHDYVVTEHPAGEGTEIVFELLGLGAPSALQLVGAALSSDDLLRVVLEGVGGAGMPSADDGVAALRSLAETDLGKIGAELSRSFNVGKAPAALVRKLVSRAHRDGQKVATVYDSAYQANYWELAQLVGKIVSINRFFPGPSTSAS